MIKFRYVYSNGKEIKSFIYTIEEIGNGIHSNKRVLMNLHGFKLIGRDRFTGLKDKNVVDIFENDIVWFSDDEDLTLKIEFAKGSFGWYSYPDKPYCQFVPIAGMRNTDKELLEIISNTHIETLKD